MKIVFAALSNSSRDERVVFVAIVEATSEFGVDFVKQIRQILSSTKNVVFVVLMEVGNERRALEIVASVAGLEESIYSGKLLLVTKSPYMAAKFGPEVTAKDIVAGLKL